MTETDISGWKATGDRFLFGVKVLSAVMVVVTVANAYIGRKVNERVESLSHQLAQADSLARVRETAANDRANRMQLVLELQATALVEGKESEDGREAVRQLRALRHVMPR